MLTNPSSSFLKIMQYSELEGIHKDHPVQLPAPHSTTQVSNPMSESTVQMLLELRQIGPMTLGACSIPDYLLGKEPFPNTQNLTFQDAAPFREGENPISSKSKRRKGQRE